MKTRDLNQTDFKSLFSWMKRRTPTLFDVVLSELLYPEQKAVLYVKPKRERMLRGGPDDWTVKLTRKYDRLIFPELTNGDTKLSEAKKMARVLMVLKENSPEPDKLHDSLFGRKVAQRLTDAAWRQDSEFLREFATALNRPSYLRRQYSFMLRHAEEIDQLKTVADVYRFVSAKVKTQDRSTFYTTCKQIGLPVSEG